MTSIVKKIIKFLTYSDWVEISSPPKWVVKSAESYYNHFIKKYG
jgi:hypothetical protein